MTNEITIGGKAFKLGEDEVDGARSGRLPKDLLTRNPNLIGVPNPPVTKVVHVTGGRYPNFSAKIETPILRDEITAKELEFMQGGMSQVVAHCKAVEWIDDNLLHGKYGNITREAGHFPTNRRLNQELGKIVKYIKEERRESSIAVIEKCLPSAINHLNRVLGETEILEPATSLENAQTSLSLSENNWRAIDDLTIAPSAIMDGDRLNKKNVRQPR